MFTPTGAPGYAVAEDTGLVSVDQLCAVSGTLALEGTEREIACTGWRGSVDRGLELDGLESFRQACGWIAPDDGLSVLALRPPRSRGHEADIVVGAVLEPEAAPRVADPRLSTTYDSAGRPARVGLELWLEEETPVEDPEADTDRQFPRRAAGEAIAPGLDWEVADVVLHATALRWHSRGADGVGVYLLGRPA